MVAKNTRICLEMSVSISNRIDIGSRSPTFRLPKATVSAKAGDFAALAINWLLVLLLLLLPGMITGNNDDDEEKVDDDVEFSCSFKNERYLKRRSAPFRNVKSLKAVSNAFKHPMK